MKRYWILITAFVVLLLISPIVAIIISALFIFIYLGWESLARRRGYNDALLSIESLRLEIESLVQLAESEMEECIKISQESEILFNERAYQPYWDSINNFYVKMQNLRKTITIIKEGEATMHIKISSANQLKCEYLIDKKIYWPLFSIILNLLKNFSKKSNKNKQIQLCEESFIYGNKKASAIFKIFKLKKPFEESIRNLSSTLQKADRDYQFSSIYQQIRTNIILERGFNDLNNAIKKLSTSVSDKFEELYNSIEFLNDLDGSSNTSSNSNCGKDEESGEDENISITIVMRKKDNTEESI